MDILAGENLSEMDKQICNFLLEKEPNLDNFTFKDILKLTDSELERNHHYIQWVFPLSEPSQAVPDSPFLDEIGVKYILNNTTIKNNIKRMLARMMQFYSTANFITPGNHNFLRITRILKCLSNADLDEDALLFYNFIISQADTQIKQVCIQDSNIHFWQPAIKTRNDTVKWKVDISEYNPNEKGIISLLRNTFKKNKSAERLYEIVLNKYTIQKVSLYCVDGLDDVAKIRYLDEKRKTYVLTITVNQYQLWDKDYILIKVKKNRVEIYCPYMYDFNKP